MCGKISETSIPLCPYFRNLKRARHQRPRMALTNDDVAFARERLARVLIQRGFWIERVHVADAAAHEERDDAFRAGREMRLLRSGVFAPGRRMHPSASSPSWLSRAATAEAG